MTLAQGQEMGIPQGLDSGGSVLGSEKGGLEGCLRPQVIVLVPGLLEGEMPTSVAVAVSSPAFSSAHSFD